jgi:hypothetical protein
MTGHDVTTIEDLSDLADRLSLPPGWSYESRIPTSAVVVDTSGRDAMVTQDDPGNSYSLQFDP